MNMHTCFQTHPFLPLPCDAPPPCGPRVLLASAEHGARARLALALTKFGYCVAECSNGVDMVIKLGGLAFPVKPEGFDLIIADARMPGISGLEILEAVRSQEGHPPFIVMTGPGERTLFAKARRLGATAVFRRPMDMETLVDHVMRVVPPLATAQGEA
ncbi:MAG TPA: response regulator [Deltaproteobacteria bacterium]|nr:response regulator [Deltaproteobacteria bacterium]HQI80127.1 response regulator [Deltaproteobacteria bacterium]